MNKMFSNCKNISTDNEVMSKIELASFLLERGVYSQLCFQKEESKLPQLLKSF